MNRHQRRHSGKPSGMSFAAQLAQRQAYKKAIQQAANDTAVQVKSDIHVQKVMWLMCVAMNDAFGIGPDRFKRFAECLQERSDWYTDMVNSTNEVYADEKLRREAQRCSGIDIEYLYEAEALAANKKREEELLCR